MVLAQPLIPSYDLLSANSGQLPDVYGKSEVGPPAAKTAGSWMASWAVCSRSYLASTIRWNKAAASEKKKENSWGCVSVEIRAMTGE